MTPTETRLAFDQRIRSLYVLIDEVKQLKALSEEMASWRSAP